MATSFDRGLLASLAQKEHLRLGTPAGSGEHVSRLWFVIHQGFLYIRSARGERAAWYRILRDHPLATLLWADDTYRSVPWPCRRTRCASASAHISGRNMRICIRPLSRPCLTSRE